MRTVVFARTAENPPHPSRAAAECESPARKCRVKRNKFESPGGTTLAPHAPGPCTLLMLSTGRTEVSEISDCPPFTVLRRMDNPDSAPTLGAQSSECRLNPPDVQSFPTS